MKNKNKLSLDDLKGLCFHFVGEFENPKFGKIKPFLLTFGGRVFNVIDNRINYIILGKKSNINKKEINKIYPKISFLNYDDFLKLFDLKRFV